MFEVDYIFPNAFAEPSTGIIEAGSFFTCSGKLLLNKEGACPNPLPGPKLAAKLF